MSSADIAACFPSEHDSLLGTDVESRRRSSKPFYLTRSSLETRKKEQGGLAGWWARFGEGGTILGADDVARGGGVRSNANDTEF